VWPFLGIGLRLAGSVVTAAGASLDELATGCMTVGSMDGIWNGFSAPAERGVLGDGDSVHCKSSTGLSLDVG